MLSINYADTMLDNLTVIDQAKVCNFSKIVGGSGFWLKNPRITEYRGLTVEASSKKQCQEFYLDYIIYIQHKNIGKNWRYRHFC